MNNKSHLTLAHRLTIEALLGEQCSIRFIADKLDKSPSTISREIRKHTITKKPRSCDCANASGCSSKHLCSSKACNKRCKTCPIAKKHCEHYLQVHCKNRCHPTMNLCNGCSKKAHCHLEKHFYDGTIAENAYRKKLTDTRNGFNLTLSELIHINEVVSPRIKKGQSLYHIMKDEEVSLNISESTLRRLIANGETDVCLIDLPETVKRKKRKLRRVPKLKVPRKTGHLYSDFKRFLEENDCSVVQMDCVEGKKEDTKVLLTLHFTSLRMQLIFCLETHTAQSVVNLFDEIEKTLGKELFSICFPVLLTDNGHEFSDIEGIETSIFGGKRTKLFFCEPNRSDQKGQCENNHKLIRNILPQGTSFEKLTRMETLTIMNHINSYTRESLFGKSPYDMAMNTLPKEFFTKLGLKKIRSSDVNLTPKLLKH